jgi:hypothetical protein
MEDLDQLTRLIHEKLVGKRKHHAAADRLIERLRIKLAQQLEKKDNGQ